MTLGSSFGDMSELLWFALSNSHCPFRRIPAALPRSFDTRSRPPDPNSAPVGYAAVSGLCEERIVIVTGAGRGIGREHARAFAAEGAKVVVNDLGVARDGTGQHDQGPAQDVVDEIRAAGGEAIANTNDIADFAGA